MKFIMTRCNIICAKTKSAKARSGLMLPNSVLFCGLTCTLRQAEMERKLDIKTHYSIICIEGKKNMLSNYDSRSNRIKLSISEHRIHSTINIICIIFMWMLYFQYGNNRLQKKKTALMQIAPGMPVTAYCDKIKVYYHCQFYFTYASKIQGTTKETITETIRKAKNNHNVNAWFHIEEKFQIMFCRNQAKSVSINNFCIIPYIYIYILQ